MSDIAIATVLAAVISAISAIAVAWITARGMRSASAPTQTPPSPAAMPPTTYAAAPPHVQAPPPTSVPPGLSSTEPFVPPATAHAAPAPKLTIMFVSAFGALFFVFAAVFLYPNALFLVGLLFAGILAVVAYILYQKHVNVPLGPSSTQPVDTPATEHAAPAPKLTIVELFELPLSVFGALFFALGAVIAFPSALSLGGVLFAGIFAFVTYGLLQKHVKWKRSMQR